MRQTWGKAVAGLALAVAMLGTGGACPAAAARAGASPAAGAAPQAAAKVQGKDEVVYANLAGDGSVQSVYVVNEFEVAQAGTLTDFGDYGKVTNLTSVEAITQDGQRVSVAAEPGQFYYQGTLNGTGLPWLFAITYSLNGVPTDAAGLAGKDGLLEIKLSTRQNTAIDPVFYDNYMLQVSLTLDAEKCGEIQSEGGTLANAGKNKMVTHTVMPGKDADIVISANVRDFAMGGFEIAAMPFSMSVELPDTGEVTEGMTSLAGAIDALNDGVGKLAAGARDLNSGAVSLVDGSATFADGMSALGGNAGRIVDGSAKIKAALQQIAAGLGGSAGGGDLGLGDLAALPGQLNQMAGNLSGLSAGITGLKDAYAAVFTALDPYIGAIGAVSAADIDALKANVPEPYKATLDALVAVHDAAQAAKGVYGGLKGGSAAVAAQFDILAGILSQIAGGLTATANGIQAALDGNEMMAQLQQLAAGLQTLSEEYGQFHAGLAEYAGGVSQAAAGYAALHGGLVAFQAGTAELAGGTQDLYAGTAELNEETAELPDTIQVEIDKLMEDYDKSDFEPISFTSPQNKNVNLVQFVFMTSGVEKASDEAPAQTEASDESPWDRLQALFRK